ncbi:MAG TPA: class I SAM-dependent methyltransferase [Streptosporangiaceae bacterium]|nr:class I SAM-dependent methyltransferase [Streptosporangiaceae bacterium]
MENSDSPRAVRPKTLTRIAEEWDAIAIKRRIQIISGNDLSFDHVLVPALQSALEHASRSSVLDIGCGTGAFTTRLAPQFLQIVGIDPSPRSIDQARADQTNIEFIVSSVEDFAKSGRSFTCVVANMVMMNTPNIFSAMDAAASLCQAGSIFAFTITHPWFWPVYWNYADADWFKYNDEIFIESEFRTSMMNSGILTTHIHRPLEMYVDAAERAGFRIAEAKEPMPSASLEKRYPHPWQFPRFLMLSCVKV